MDKQKKKKKRERETKHLCFQLLSLSIKKALEIAYNKCV